MTGKRTEDKGDLLLRSDSYLFLALFLIFLFGTFLFGTLFGTLFLSTLFLSALFLITKNIFLFLFTWICTYTIQ